jgi:hypothetical protein
MSTSLASNVRQPFDESSSCMQINDKEDGKKFVCDEEPHMLSPKQGFGYYPIILGQKLGKGKLEIMRKLGWAGHSSVWLACTLKYVHLLAPIYAVHGIGYVRNAYPVKYLCQGSYHQYNGRRAGWIASQEYYWNDGMECHH